MDDFIQNPFLRKRASRAFSDLKREAFRDSANMYTVYCYSGQTGVVDTVTDVNSVRGKCHMGTVWFYIYFFYFEIAISIVTSVIYLYFFFFGFIRQLPELIFKLIYREVFYFAKVSCILRHQGVQLRLAYSWARPAIPAAGKGRVGIFFNFFCFFTVIYFPLSPLSLPFISSTICSISSPFLQEKTQNDPQKFFCVCFSVLLALRLPRLGKRELILVLFVRLFDLCLFEFVGFLFLKVSGKGCGLWLWHSLDFSLPFLIWC